MVYATISHGVCTLMKLLIWIIDIVSIVTLWLHCNIGLILYELFAIITNSASFFRCKYRVVPSSNHVMIIDFEFDSACLSFGGLGQ